MSPTRSSVPSGRVRSTMAEIWSALRRSEPLRTRVFAASSVPEGWLVATAATARAISSRVMSWRISSRVSTTMRVSGSAMPLIVVRVTPAWKSFCTRSSAKRASWSTPTGPVITTSVTGSRHSRRTMRGASISSGRSVTPATAASTSAWARSMFQPVSNSTMISLRSSRATERVSSTPSSACSTGISGATTARSLSAGPAPSHSMLMLICSNTMSGMNCARIRGAAARPSPISSSIKRFAAVRWRAK